jgi:hypothetical protein
MITSWHSRGCRSVEGEVNVLTSRILALLEKAPNAQLLKNFPPFYETQRFITFFTRAFNLSLSHQQVNCHSLSLVSHILPESQNSNE